MADDDPWGFDAPEETPATPAKSKTSSKAGSSKATPKEPKSPGKSGAASGAASGAVTPKASSTRASTRATTPSSEHPPEHEDVPVDDRIKPVQLYRHWVRPKFLQYKYVYDYRVNYYDDVIDYLDKRQRGLKREIPRPQTWAERVMRTNASRGYLDTCKQQLKEDHHLIQTIASSIKTHNYHTKAYINRKYSSIL